MSMEQIIEKYFRPGRLPHIWCPGCSNGIVTGAIVKAIDRVGIEKDEMAIVSGIGCSSRASGYVDFNTVHSAHGRAIPFATGIKLAKPEMKVLVVTGDGDCTAIGGNHLIHAARRNIDLTVVVFNNNIYGMTGGQYSPLTPTHSKASTAPYKTVDPAFDLSNLAKGAGATFVARGTAFHTQQLVDIIAQGIKHKGFSIIEVICSCPISYGRQNKLGDAPNMMKWQRDHAVPITAWDKLDEEKRKDKFPIGVLYKAECPEYTEEYAKIIASAQKEGK